MEQHLIDVADDLFLLLSVMPNNLQAYLKQHPKRDELTEIILDLGRKPEVRFSESEYQLTDLKEVDFDVLEDVIARLSEFNTDNRSGIERTLHRISAIRNRSGKVVGLTCRVGRAVVGTIEIIRDIVESGKNILFLGKPGIGKTTKLRETARVLADDMKKRVVVVDTSNEIAGDGDIPHSGIGSARRMQVPTPEQQHAVMIEAVENHMPEVIIVDEIGTEAETQAARTISQRGVQLVATAHGHNLENLIKNPTLSDLVGGVQSVILGDEEAKFRGTQKTVLERKSLPTFEVLIEIRERDLFAIYTDVQYSVDLLLRGESLQPEIRRRDQQGNFEKVPQVASAPVSTMIHHGLKTTIEQPVELTIFPFALNIDKIHAAIHSLELPVAVSQSINDADIVLTVKAQMTGRSKVQQILEGRQIPVHVLKRNSSSQIVKFLRYYFDLPETDEDLEVEAVREIRQICKEVVSEHRMLEAMPRSAFYRRVQHQIADELGLNSMSIGEEPNRRVRVYPRK